MILVWFILLPFLGGILSWYAGRRNTEASRWISAAALSLDLVLALVVWFLYAMQPGWARAARGSLILTANGYRNWALVFTWPSTDSVSCW